MWKGFVAGLVVANAFEWVAHKYSCMEHTVLESHAIAPCLTV